VLGDELIALEQYFEMQKSKTTKSKYWESCALNQKRSCQRAHLLHSFTKSLSAMQKLAASPQSSWVTLRISREGKDGGSSGNQQLHKWPFDLIVKMFTYKARLQALIHADVKQTIMGVA
jgi:putative transposase